MRHRRAYTLLEMLAVITIGSTLMGITTSALYLFVKMEGQGRQNHQRQTSLARLADRFRRDVHASQRPPHVEGQAPEQVAWKFETGEHEAIEYRSESGGLTRLETANGKIRRQEWYPLAEPCAVSLELKPEGPVQMVSLRITAPPSAGHAAPGISLRIEAQLAADHRFDRVQSESVPGKEGTP